jgi:hypothetical protein
MPDEKLFIGICNSQEDIPSGFFWSFISMKMVTPYQAFRSGHPWDAVRNNAMIAEFLKSDCTVFAKMDIDQVYPPDYFERLIPLTEKYAVVGPMIYDRWEQSQYMPLAFDKVNDYNFPISQMNLDGLSGVVEVPFPHTNLVYRREVFEKVNPPWYQAYLSMDGLERLNHVDYTLIDKIHQAGFKVMIDLDLEVKHRMVKFIGKVDAEYARANIIL